MTRVGSQTGFAGGTLIKYLFFSTSPLQCALQVHVTESNESILPPTTTEIFTCSIPVVTVLYKAKEHHLEFSVTGKPEAYAPSKQTLPLFILNDIFLSYAMLPKCPET